METIKIKIPIPNGFEVESFDIKSGEALLKEKPKDVLSRILTDDDVLADNGYTLDTFNKWCEGLRVYERADRFLELLHNSLNGDWVPDFDNANQTKWRPWFTGGSRGFRCSDYDDWYSHSNVGSRLCLKEERLAIHAGTKFTKWFKASIIK
jgi:hypothetical protein